MILKRMNVAQKKSDMRRSEEYQRNEAIRRQRKKKLSSFNRKGEDLYKGESKEPKKYFISDDNFQEMEFTILVPSFDRSALIDNLQGLENKKSDFSQKKLTEMDVLPFFDIDASSFKRANKK